MCKNLLSETNWGSINCSIFWSNSWFHSNNDCHLLFITSQLGCIVTPLASWHQLTHLTDSRSPGNLTPVSPHAPWSAWHGPCLLCTPGSPDCKWSQWPGGCQVSPPLCHQCQCCVRWLSWAECTRQVAHACVVQTLTRAGAHHATALQHYLHLIKPLPLNHSTKDVI